MQSSLDDEGVEDYDSYDAQAFVLVDKEMDAVKFTKTPSPKITSPVSPKSPSQSSIKPFPKAGSSLLVKLKFDADNAKKCEFDSFQCTANSENIIEAKSNNEAWLIDFHSSACVENENIETKECIQTLQTDTEVESDVSDNVKVEACREDNKMPSQMSISIVEKGECDNGKEENEAENQGNIMVQMFTKVEDDVRENSETENITDTDEQACTGWEMIKEKHDESLQDSENGCSEEKTNVHFKLAQALAKIEKNDRGNAEVKLDNENIEEDDDFSQMIGGKEDDGAKNNEADKNVDIFVDQINAGKEQFAETDFETMENETSSQALHEKENDGENINKNIMVDQNVFEWRGNVTDSFETEQDKEETTNGKEENIAGSEGNDLEINTSTMVEKEVAAMEVHVMDNEKVENETVAQMREEEGKEYVWNNDESEVKECIMVGKDIAPMEVHVLDSAKIENETVAQMKEEEGKEYVWNNDESEVKECIMVAGNIGDMNSGTSYSINGELETEENEICEQIAKEKKDFKEEDINGNEFLTGGMKEDIIVAGHVSEMKENGQDIIECKLETEETEIGRQNSREKSNFEEENNIGNEFQRGKMKECIMVAGKVDEMNDGLKDSIKSELETEKTGESARIAAQKNREYSLSKDSIEIEINQEPIDNAVDLLNDPLVKKEVTDHAEGHKGNGNGSVGSNIESGITKEVINKSIIVLRETDFMMDMREEDVIDNVENESNQGIINDYVDAMKKSCDETGSYVINVNENGKIQVNAQILSTGDSMEIKSIEGSCKSRNKFDDCDVETKRIQYPVCDKDDSAFGELVCSDLFVSDVSDIEKIDEEENWVESFLEQEGRSSTYGSQIEVNDASEKECSIAGLGNSIDLKVDIALNETRDNEKKSFASDDKPMQAHPGFKKIVTVHEKEKTARDIAKEEILNKRIIEIRRKNEERLRRAEEIERDKRQAEILERKAKSSSEDHHIVAVSRVTNVRSRGRGRGISQVNKYTDSPRRTFIGRGRGSMRSDDFREKIRGKDNFKDTKVDLEKNEQMGDEVRKEKELASRSSWDDRRASQLHQHRLPRSDYLSFREKRKKQKQMTNKEKEEYNAYNAWKTEREAIEEARIKRHKEVGGKWVREWDQEKIWDHRSRQWVPNEQESIERERKWGFRAKEKNRGDSFTANTEEEW